MRRGAASEKDCTWPWDTLDAGELPIFAANTLPLFPCATKAEATIAQLCPLICLK